MEHKPVILVVDDDMPIIILMRSLLREFGFDPLTASNGQEAIATAAKSKPDVILLDKNMPGSTIEDVIRGLRGATGGASVPIVILSGEPVDAEELRTLGAEAAVQKPFDVQALVNQIRGFVTTSS